MKTISILNEHDLADAYQLELLCHLVPWSKQIFYSNQGDRYLNLKISIDEQMVGFCICQQVADEANLFNIAIHPKFRQQGLAKDLLNELISRLLTINPPNSPSTLWLEVRESNQVAIQLYHSLGFNEITIRKNYYPTADGNYENAIIMAYALKL
ncbi:ribosomal protein S18-alanine N-acetyltransferase [Gilliamella sp. wkB112]|uniref:ribosomal protein S18-alanine N-acetyltransferase n=1 Tax=Gilliamella sp. wkB112 TaxID=3120257 RepID=UPI00080E9009|nr:ribosomal protein S18-alanine N-acetyltransferase [Gilliamella apicola]OCG03154.1 ribosomal-protein-alanine N-acetyltransferase [Gilliamella apicola]